MKRLILVTSALVFIFVAVGPGIWAQESDEFVLEDVVVTAEKREVNVQDVPASLKALVGADLLEQGKITTEQILESVPNLLYRYGGGPNPLGNISIRGIQRTQEAGGVQEVLPSTTAVYVDGVYLGIGGHYDVDRVEVLRGPQGTLYGRSATGGVVAFHTKNPVLGTFGASGHVEYGTASLWNLQAVVNVPLGDKFALRGAVHSIERDGYHNTDGGRTETTEGRLKLLWQPVDQFEIVLSGSLQETTNWGGGQNAALSAPNTIDYTGGSYSEPAAGAPEKHRQIAANVNYDLGGSTLTYVGGFHDYDYSGVGAEGMAQPGHMHVDVREWPVNDYHSHEMRWASNTEGSLSWLVGVNFFRHEYDQYMGSYQTRFPPDPFVPPEEGFMVAKWDRKQIGTFENYGIFTEETFKLSDDFRITAGLRYDETEVVQSIWFRQNLNLSPNNTSILPYIWNIAELIDDTHEYDNLTYKLRFEYDLTPDNMLYLLTATGFLPGTASLSPGAPGTFNILILPEQELTSYEVGSKNQFLDNRMRLNAAIFYYDYEGYPEAVNINPGGGPPTFQVMPVELGLLGMELDIEYLITDYDRLSFSTGYLKTELSGFPETMTWVPMAPPGFPPPPPYDTPGSYAFMLDELPGFPEWMVNLAYDHTFYFDNDSTLVPRAEVVYTSDYYINQLNYKHVENGTMPYNEREALTLVNIGATWTSPTGMWSITGYGRNVFDEDYKRNVMIRTTAVPPGIPVTPGDPQTWGVMVRFTY